MRDFKEPFYEGKQCKCCSPKPTEKVTKAYNRGVQEERQRIIKLLEDRSKCGAEHDYNGYCYCEEIALIKGENK